MSSFLYIRYLVIVIALNLAAESEVFLNSNLYSQVLVFNSLAECLNNINNIETPSYSTITLGDGVHLLEDIFLRISGVGFRLRMTSESSNAIIVLKGQTKMEISNFSLLEMTDLKLEAHESFLLGGVFLIEKNSSFYLHNFSFTGMKKDLGFFLKTYKAQDIVITNFTLNESQIIGYNLFYFEETDFLSIQGFFIKRSSINLISIIFAEKISQSLSLENVLIQKIMGAFCFVEILLSDNLNFSAKNIEVNNCMPKTTLTLFKIGGISLKELVISQIFIQSCSCLSSLLNFQRLAHLFAYNWTILNSQSDGKEALVQGISSESAVFNKISLQLNNFSQGFFFVTHLTNFVSSQATICKNSFTKRLMVFEFLHLDAGSLTNSLFYQNEFSFDSSLFFFSRNEDSANSTLLYFSFSSCSFTSNFGISLDKTLDYRRQSILFVFKALAEVAFNATIFNYNFMLGYGGNPCLSLYNPNSHLLITNATFWGNSVGAFSNILYFSGKIFYFSSSLVAENFKENTLFSATSGIIFEGHEASILNCTFASNSADSGSILHIISSSVASRTIVLIAFCEFFNNTTGLKIEEVNYLIFNMKASIAKNNYQGFMNAVYFTRRNHSYAWIDCHFFNNSAIKGGVINMYTLDSILNIFNCLFYYNSALKFGGAIYLFSSWKLYFFTYFCVFRSNYAFQSGTLAVVLANYFDYGSVFEKNTAYQISTLVVSTNSVVSLQNTQIKMSISQTSSNINVYDQAFLIMTEVTIEGCISKSTSAGIAVYSFSRVSVENSTFLMNQAHEGTVFFSTYSKNKIFLKNCVFSKNVAARSLFFFESTLVSFANLSINDNIGRIFFSSNLGFEIEQLRISDNFCEIHHLGCMFLIHQTTLSIKNFTLINISSRASNLFLAQNSEVNLTDSKILGFSIENLDEAAFFDFADSHLNLNNSSTGIYYAVLIQALRSAVKISNSNIFGQITEAKFSLKSSALKSIDSISFIENSSFRNLHEGAVYMIGNHLSRLKGFVSNSTFSFNKCKNGGAFRIYSVDVIFNQTLFSMNFAESNGGAVEINCEASVFDCIVEFSNSKFEVNTALRGSGGAIYWVYSNVSTRNCEFSGNKAVDGDNIASQSFRIIIENYIDLNNRSLVDFLPGSTVQAISFSILDFYNQTIKSLSGAKARLDLSKKKQGDNISKFEAKGSLNALSSDGRFDFSYVTLLGSPGTEGIISLETDFILGTNHTFRLEVKFSQCDPGQIYSPLKYSCETCPRDYFSLEPNDTKCKMCPENSYCPGGKVLSLNNGYWRHKFSTTVHRCKKPFACPGGEDPSLCSEGYYGVLCDSCSQKDQKNASYFLNLDGKCAICSVENYTKSILVMMLIFLIICTYVVYLIKCELSNKYAVSTLLFKIINHHFQLLFLTFDLQISVLLDIREILKFQRGFDNPSVLFNGFDCLMTEIFEDINIYFKKIIAAGVVSLLIPLIVPVIWILKFFLLNARSLNKKTPTLFSNISTSLIIIFYTFQASYINQFMDALTCVKIDDQIYIKNYLAQICWNESHLRLVYALIIPLLVIWMFLLPFSINYSLYKRSLRGFSIDSYSYVLIGYKKKYFFWDFVLMIEKYLIILSSIFIPSDLLLGFAYNFICFFYLYVQIKFRPFESAQFNKLFLQSSLSTFISVLGGSLSAYSNNKSFYYSLLIISFAINTYFLGSWVFFFFKHEKSLQPIIKMLKKIGSRKKTIKLNISIQSQQRNLE